MEERRLFNSKIMWEMLPDDRLGIERLVDALNAAFSRHIAKEYDHLFHDKQLTLQRFPTIKNMIERRQRNNEQEINSFYPSFEENRIEKLIALCQGFGETILTATNGTRDASQLHSELNDMHYELRESLLETCPRRYVMPPRRNRREQGECKTLKVRRGPADV